MLLCFQFFLILTLLLNCCRQQVLSPWQKTTLFCKLFRFNAIWKYNFSAVLAKEKLLICSIDLDLGNKGRWDFICFLRFSSLQKIPEERGSIEIQTFLLDIFVILYFTWICIIYNYKLSYKHDHRSELNIYKNSTCLL